MLKSNVTLMGTPAELMKQPVCEVRDTDDRMWDRADHDNRFSFSMLSESMTPVLYSHLTALGLTDKDIIQIALAYKCSNKECNYEVRPRVGDEEARLYNIYKHEWNYVTKCYPQLEFYEDQPKGPAKYAFHIDAVVGGRENRQGYPIEGSTNEALRKQLLHTGFTLHCAKEANKAKTKVQSYYGHIGCNNCIGPAGWRKYRNSSGNKYECPACLVNWSSRAPGTRWMKLSNSCGISFILELDEPESALLNDWKKERVEYYKRFEPVDALRNQGISLPSDGDLTSIITLEGAASNAFWFALLNQDSTTSIKNVNAQFLHQHEELEPNSD